MFQQMYFVLGLIALLGAGCRKVEPTPWADSVRAGGAGTVFSDRPDAYTFPLPNLSAAGIQRHLLADGAFGQQFASAPAGQFGGLGPLFNQNSCEACHTRNGRGALPQYEGDPSTGLLLRLSLSGSSANGAPLAVPDFGTQLQHKGIFGVSAEGRISKTETQEIVSYLDGRQISLRKPRYTVASPYAPLPADLLVSPRVASPVYGLGLLEAISESDILANADADDADGDGISGRPNMVWDVSAASLRLGRFGWKAEQPTALQQSAAAAHDDMGLTSSYFPAETCAGQSNCQTGLQAVNDVDDETIDLFAFYFQTLAVPAQRVSDWEKFAQGGLLFERLQCATCHRVSYETGIHAISELSGQRIYPYTDLLLHDMGEGLADGRASFAANGREWRTPPLWGIGLAQIVNSRATFLHDGRAQSIEEAILWHGGEAAAAQAQFRALSNEERAALLAFLQAL